MPNAADYKGIAVPAAVHAQLNDIAREIEAETGRSPGSVKLPETLTRIIALWHRMPRGERL